MYILLFALSILNTQIINCMYEFKKDPLMNGGWSDKKKSIYIHEKIQLLFSGEFTIWQVNIRKYIPFSNDMQCELCISNHTIPINLSMCQQGYALDFKERIVKKEKSIEQKFYRFLTLKGPEINLKREFPITENEKNELEIIAKAFIIFKANYKVEARKEQKVELSKILAALKKNCDTFK